MYFSVNTSYKFFMKGFLLVVGIIVLCYIDRKICGPLDYGDYYDSGDYFDD